MAQTARSLAWGSGVLAAAGGLALSWSLAEAHMFRLRFVEVPVLRPGQAPMSVLHLSDLHLTPSQGDKKRWVAALNRLEPDLVVATGDFLSHRLAVPHVLDALGPLLDRPGVFTLGSNDYLAPRPLNPFRYFSGPSELSPGREILPWRDLVAGLTAGGWADLDNRKTQLGVGGRVVDARGVDDPHIELDRYEEVAGPFDPDATLRLGVAHAPYLRVLDAMVRDGADLILAGHTHGGQLRVPGFGALVTNCDIDRRRSRGLSSHSVTDPVSVRPEGSTSGEADLLADSRLGRESPRVSALHVSAGLGTSPYAPIRFACPPEATLLSLVARDSD